ncbi:uncharacterized protein CEXT_100391 [Caerostris extrusa]|uniref:Sushi domain-containing protein n=1 Tax=Caerostris extrusa TaxID=172846 RepID=A0AAV4NEE7_CAEEX|nr:uncharacterized protein CEXT_100391 [Caerostris extrusa]
MDSSSNVKCIATYCSEPKQPQFGSTKCDQKDVKELSFKSKYRNGTHCHFQCNAGYVIPKSQQHLNKIICHAPHWNDSIPECKRKFVPRPYSSDCRNLTLMANRRGVGTYINFCSAHNPELKTTGHCTYNITVKENSCPNPPDIPHSSLICDNGDSHSFPRGTVCKYMCKDGFVMPKRVKKFQSIKCTSKLKWHPTAVPHCKRSVPPKPAKGACKSKIIVLGSDTSVKIRLPKFRSSLKGSKIKVNCTLNGTLPEGNYTNYCQAVDKQLGLSSSCSYNISIQATGCIEFPIMPPLSMNCTNVKKGKYFPFGTVCDYACDDGFVIPASSLSNSMTMCIAHEQWNNSVVPPCVYQTPPIPEANSCLNESAVVADLETFFIPNPTFKSSTGQVIEAECEPQNLTEYGLYSINCTAFDSELKIHNSCSFEFELLEENVLTELPREEILGCLALPTIEFGSINCSVSKSDQLFPIGTTCNYVCENGYIIPTSSLEFSEKMCIGDKKWRNSLVPSYVYQSAPVPEDNACLHHSIRVEEFDIFQYSIPHFNSSSGIIIESNCEPQNVTDYGVHNITCFAYDSELRIDGFCSFELNIQAPNYIAALAEEISCSYTKKIENGDIECNSTDSTLFSVGTVCEIICQKGFSVPLSQQNLSILLCLPNGDWNTSHDPLCLKYEPPVLISGCENSSMNTSDLSSIDILLPTFLTSHNTSASVVCTDGNVTEYGKQEVSCTAYDHELNISNMCKFYLDIKYDGSLIPSSDTTVENSGNTINNRNSI